MAKQQQEFFVNPLAVYPPDFVEWMELTLAERLVRTAQIWDIYIAYGGSFDPDPDPQSPFFDSETQSSGSANGRSGLRLVRRC